MSIHILAAMSKKPVQQSVQISKLLATFHGAICIVARQIFSLFTLCSFFYASQIAAEFRAGGLRTGCENWMGKKRLQHSPAGPFHHSPILVIKKSEPDLARS